MRPVRANDLVGLPVVSLETGEALGTVKDVVISARTGRVRAFSLDRTTLLSSEDRDRLPLRAVPIRAVRAVGPDAVMVDGEPGLQEQGSDARDDDVISVDAVSESGNKLGSVRDVIVDAEGGGTVLGYEIETEGSAKLLVRGEDAIAISGDALVVSEEAEAKEWNELAGFGSDVQPREVSP